MPESIDSLEGRLLAHRKILALLIDRHGGGTADGTSLHDALRDISQMQLQEEDPGAVPGDGISIEGAIADEARRLLDLTGRKGDPDGG